MENQAMRPVWALTGEQLLTELDILHAQIASLQTRRLHVMAGIDDLGYAKDIGATDTARLLAFRHRLDATAVRHDLKLAKALPKYQHVTAALPDPSTPDHHHHHDHDHDGPLQHDQPATQDNSDPNPYTEPTIDGDSADGTQSGLNANACDADQDGVTANAGAPDQDGGAADHGGDPAAQTAPVLLHPAQADALVNILNAAAESGNAASGHGGIKPCLMVTIDLDALKTAGAQATGDLHFGEGLSAAAVRRLACDANIIPIVLGANSEPLDVGRAKRFVTETIRQALIARDRGCVPCGAPPDQCDAHHIVSWTDGGPTSLDNLVLQCKPDHRAVHRGEFIITITNGTVHVTRPTWAESAPTRTRNRHQPGDPTPTTAPDTNEPAAASDFSASASPPAAAHPSEAAGSPGAAATPGTAGSAGSAASHGTAGSPEAAGSCGEAGFGGPAGAAGSAGSRGPLGLWGDPPDPGNNHGRAADGRSPDDARARPRTSDPQPLTREAALQLAPWGDNEDDNLPPARREPTPPPA